MGGLISAWSNQRAGHPLVWVKQVLPDGHHIGTEPLACSPCSTCLCFPEIYLNFSWRVTEDLCGSDHYPMCLKTPRVVPAACVPRWRIGRADWTAFLLLAGVDHCLDFDEVDDTVAYFAALMQQSAEHSTPQTSGTVRHKPVGWWCRECRQLVWSVVGLLGVTKATKQTFTGQPINRPGPSHGDFEGGAPCVFSLLFELPDLPASHQGQKFGSVCEGHRGGRRLLLHRCSPSKAPLWWRALL